MSIHKVCVNGIVKQFDLYYQEYYLSVYKRKNKFVKDLYRFTERIVFYQCKIKRVNMYFQGIGKYLILIFLS